MRYGAAHKIYGVFFRQGIDEDPGEVMRFHRGVFPRADTCDLFKRSVDGRFAAHYAKSAGNGSCEFFGKHAAFLRGERAAVSGSFQQVRNGAFSHWDRSVTGRMEYKSGPCHSVAERFFVHLLSVGLVYGRQYE